MTSNLRRHRVLQQLVERGPLLAAFGAADALIEVDLRHLPSARRERALEF
jgi:hypothetical protein